MSGFGGALTPRGRRTPRFVGETTHERPAQVDVRCTYTPGRGWEARLLDRGPEAGALFGRAATPGLAVASLVELAAHLIWREGGG